MAPYKSISLALLLSTSILSAEQSTPEPLLDTFLIRDGVLSFDGGTWSTRTAGDKGFASLKVGDAEFLFQSEQVGGFLFSDQNPAAQGVPLFPDISNIAHDESVGRTSNVGNGLHLVSLTALPYLERATLYLGANSPDENLTAKIFLSPDVQEVLAGKKTVRLGDKSAKAGSLTLVHKSGARIRIEHKPEANAAKENGPELEVGTVRHPSGQDVLAVTLPSPGFKANTYELILGPGKEVPNYVSEPRFDVKSSEDPAEATLGAAKGVLNPVYTKDTKLDFGMQFEWKGEEPFNGYAELEVVHSLGQPHYYERVPIENKPAGLVKVKFHPKFELPGVSEVWVRLVGADKRMLWNDRYRMAYEIENFQPDIQVDPDFQAFWDETLKELRKTPLDPKTVRVEKYKDFPELEIYQASFNGWDGKRIHALLYVPREGKRPFPAIVVAHPAVKGFGISKGPDGVYGSAIRIDPRFVTILPLVQGYEPDSPGIPFNHPWWGPMGDRDDYAARAWYCSLVRAVDYLATRPDIVDINQVVASGGSQGGAFALVTAGLDPRIAYCFADCPSNGQPHEIMTKYGSFGPSRGRIPEGSSVEEVSKMLSYYNPVNFAALITCPTYIGSNIGDLTVHSMGPIAAYRNLEKVPADKKAFYPGFHHGHGSGPGLVVKRLEIFEKIAGPLPTP